MGKVLNFPTRKRAKRRLSPDPVYTYGTAPVQPSSLILVCDELESSELSHGLVAYQITFEGPEELLCILMRKVKGMAQRISNEKNGFIVVLPNDFIISSGLEIVAEEVTARVVSAVALGPPL
jgi:hypothetical protein